MAQLASPPRSTRIDRMRPYITLARAHADSPRNLSVHETPTHIRNAAVRSKEASSSRSGQPTTL